MAGILTSDMENGATVNVEITGGATIQVEIAGGPTIEAEIMGSGPAGDDYVLINQDKADIADLVLAALPVWTGGSY